MERKSFIISKKTGTKPLRNAPNGWRLANCYSVCSLHESDSW